MASLGRCGGVRGLWCGAGNRGVAQIMRELTAWERFGVISIGLMLLAVAFRFAVPSSTWLQVNRMDVRDALMCETVTVDYDRVIHRTFDGAYRIELDRIVADRMTIAHTTEWTPVRFDPERVVPEPTPLEWFLGQDICADMPEGNYRITVFWTINPGSFLFERDIRRVDYFHIGQLS